jgi:hypothetical protein
MLRFCIPLAAVLLASQGHAQAPGNTIGLSDAQKADILSHNTEDTVADARAGLPTSGKARAIHGEIGAEIGTHGERGMFGAAAIPLGENASATVMFEDERYGRR